MTMHVIKALAIAALTSPNGFNGFSADEMKSGLNGYLLRNNIRLALSGAERECAVRLSKRARDKATTEVSRLLKAEHGVRVTPPSTG